MCISVRFYLKRTGNHSVMQYFHTSMWIVVILLTSCRTEVASSVALLCKQTRKENFQECSWLLALPLYHFLKGFSEPFQTQVLDPAKISFNLEQELDLDSFKHRTYSSEKGCV